MAAPCLIVIGVLPQGFVNVNAVSIFGIPIPAIYALILALVMWVVTERMPLGRHLCAIGANEKAAALNGVPVRA